MDREVPQTTKTKVMISDRSLFQNTVKDALNTKFLADFAVSIEKTKQAVNTNLVSRSKSALDNSSEYYYTYTFKIRDNNMCSVSNMMMNREKPQLVILSDQSFPEVVQDTDGKGLMILRVENASFSSLKEVLKKVLPSAKGRVLARGSLVLVMLPVELLRLDVPAFLFLFSKFEKWLSVRLCTGLDDSTRGHSYDLKSLNINILPFFPPVNDDAMLQRIAQVNNNTMVKLALYPYPGSSLLHILLEAVDAAVAEGGAAGALKKRVVELGTNIVIPPIVSHASEDGLSAPVQVSIPTDSPYNLDSSLRSCDFVVSLLELAGQAVEGLDLPDINKLDLSMISDSHAPVGLNPHPSLDPAAPNVGGKIAVIGMSTAGMLARMLKSTILEQPGESKPDVQYQRLDRPLYLQDVLDRTLAFNKECLTSGDTVILDSTCNFAPAPLELNGNTPLRTGTGNRTTKKIHLVDGQMKPLVIPNDDDIEAMLNNVIQVVQDLRGRGILVVNLTPLPRYQAGCCQNEDAHSLAGLLDPVKLNNTLRDIGLYMAQTELLQPDPSDFCVVSPGVVGGDEVFQQMVTSRDNVHPKPEFLSGFVRVLLEIRKSWLDGKKVGSSPTELIPFYTGYADWIESIRRSRSSDGSRSDLRFCPVNVLSPTLTVAPRGWSA